MKRDNPRINIEFDLEYKPRFKPPNPMLIKPNKSKTFLLKRKDLPRGKVSC
jgi:hypothetical protein